MIDTEKMRVTPSDQTPSASSALPGEKAESQSRLPDPDEESTSPGSVASGEDEQGEEVQDAKPGLPFSKARCIALVATVTGASFLNVCRIIPQNEMNNLLLTVFRPSQPSQSSSFYHRSAMTWTSQKVDCNGSSLLTRLPSVSCFHNNCTISISLWCTL